jgi:hypothetical protein
LRIPAKEEDKSGILRVLRYLRRSYNSFSTRPTGDLRVPPSLKAGIDTIRACRIFGLGADAERIERMVEHSWMGNDTWIMTDEHVEMIWDGYGGTLRDTVFGDAIVWFLANELEAGTHPFVEDISCLLEQDEYEILKERIECEASNNGYGQETRDNFLERCREEREKKYTESEQSKAPGVPSKDEPAVSSSDLERVSKEISTEENQVDTDSVHVNTDEPPLIRSEWSRENLSGVNNSTPSTPAAQRNDNVQSSSEESGPRVPQPQSRWESIGYKHHQSGSNSLPIRPLHNHLLDFIHNPPPSRASDGRSEKKPGLWKRMKSGF